MNRRNFLCNSFYMGSALWFEQNLLHGCSALAKAVKSVTHITNIRWEFCKVKETEQTYFRLVVAASAKCEVLETQNAQYVKLVIKKCRVGKFTGDFTYQNPFAPKFEVKQINPSDSQILIHLSKTVPAVESRYFVQLPTLLRKDFLITTDVGAFSSPLSIKEADLDIKETNLKFGPLETRSDTNLIVVHHIGCTDEEVSAAQVHKWHLANGWAGIGYHYVIHKDGSIERGRPRDSVGAHTYGYNQTSIGINLVGNFEVSTPKDAQIESLTKLVAALCHIYNLSPNDATLRGHRDLNATLCPGKNLYSQMSLIRDKSWYYL